MSENNSYFLSSYGGRPSIPVSKSLYQSLIDSKAGISLIIRAEESFDALIENLVELEQEVLAYGVRHLAFASFGDEDDYHEIRRVLNRRVFHVLATARLYRDVAKRAMSIISDRGAHFKKLEDAFNDKTANSIDFRIGEALRNYSQHFELPITSVTASSKWEGEKPRERDRLAYSIRPKLNAALMAKERDLDADVRTKLIEMGTKTELMHIVRRYVENIGQLHSLFRSLYNEFDKNWTDAIREGIQKYSSEALNGDKPSVVYVCDSSKGDEKPVQLFDEYLEYFKRMKRKNSTQANLSRRYVKWAGEFED